MAGEGKARYNGRIAPLFRMTLMPKKTPTAETRRFQIDPHAIMSLIKAQSGSIEKAMLEAVANSMDAGATRIDITVGPDQIVLKDNGHGLSAEEDIYRFFEVFGFDHSQLGRSVGRFGVGRGQLFCFGVNTWRTNAFEMQIDIRKNGLDYDLRKDLKKAPGMTITIDLNEPLAASEQLHIEEQFRQLVRFCTVPVFFNGTRISKDPAKQKWTHETEDAWFQIRKDGRLQVYSQGLFVKDVWGHQYGVGGRIVTKPGRALEQNLARNDILEKECAIWKRVQSTVKKLAAEHLDKATATQDLTPEMRKLRAKEALTPEGSQSLHHEKLFTLTSNKPVTLAKLIAPGLVAMAEKFDPAADKFIQRQQAMVLDESTLERFGVDSVTELKERLLKALKAQEQYLRSRPPTQDGLPQKRIYSYHAQRLAHDLQEARFFDTLQELPLDSTIRHDLVDYRKLTPEEKAVAFGLRRQMRAVAFQVARIRNPDVHAYSLQVRERKLAFFEDNGTTEAFTDGVTTVWLNRKLMAKKGKEGVAGFMELVALLVHEHLHDESSQSAHGHPPQFYEDFHNVLLDGRVAAYGLSAYAMAIKHGLNPTSKQLSALEKTGVIIDEPVGLGTCRDDPDALGLQAEEAAPAPRKRRRSAMA